MLRSISELKGATIQPLGEAIGTVEEAYFDDEAWTVRYLVVETGSWLSGREVLISPYSVRQPLERLAADPKIIEVALTRDQVQNSPPVDTHKPISRQQEQEFLGYYGYPDYWGHGDLWAMGAFPLLPQPALPDAPGYAAPIRKEVPPADEHLRSTKDVSGYDIQASDGSIGHVKDYIFDDESWAIRYLVVDTRNWWPGGRKVLLATRWIDRIDWAESNVFTTLTRDEVKASPEYDETVAVQRDYEAKLHAAYNRDVYWK
ncbi:MAG: PRC-barrel domain-containing protein [Proteobacteria bacterium]|nr:PRC-barrel domain-containing protein [Pseudomonadota bacterium]